MVTFAGLKNETRDTARKNFLLLQTHSFGRFLSSKNLEKNLSKTDLLPRRLQRSGVRHCTLSAKQPPEAAPLSHARQEAASVWWSDGDAAESLLTQGQRRAAREVWERRASCKRRGGGCEERSQVSGLTMRTASRLRIVSGCGHLVCYTAMNDTMVL